MILLLGDPVRVAQELECVTGNTKIRIKNKNTGVVETVTIEKFFETLNQNMA